MTAPCQHATSAEPTPQPNGGDRAFFVSCRGTFKAGSDTALTMKPTPQPKSLPPLVLTSTHRREAMILDLNAAVKRRDMRAVHALEQQLARLTTMILRREC